ncbi:MAG: acyl-CoA/acyl-ACP dehydrogenase [Chloroflexi bacterium]|nr:acyl-CoA/acyl-ACP dehydrogenase [Chloroflexota bacterium]
MDLALNEAQSLLARTARDFLAQECPLKLVRAMEEDPTGFPAALWKQLAELGWLGLALPEEVGGSGGDLVDLCVLLEEMGRALLPGPFLPAIVPVATTIARLGRPEQRQELLPAIIRGERIVTWAGQEPAARYDPLTVATSLQEEHGTLVLRGTKLFVAYASVANAFLVVARDGAGFSLVLVENRLPGVETTELVVVDRSKQAEVSFHDVRVLPAAILGERGQAQAAIERALAEWTVATCAWMVGAMERAFELAVDYSKTRVQFGRPIGSFQALQHKAANMLVDVEGARLVTFQAASALRSGQSAEREVAIAKGWTSDASRRVTTEAHQMHGAIGFTWEYDLQLYTRRLRVLESTLGDADYHRKRVAAALGL